MAKSNKKHLVFDEWSGRYFRSNLDLLDRGVADANKLLLTEGDVSLNEFYTCIGLDILPMGDKFGWLADAPIELCYSAIISPKGAPAISFTFRKDPNTENRV